MKRDVVYLVVIFCACACVNILLFVVHVIPERSFTVRRLVFPNATAILPLQSTTPESLARRKLHNAPPFDDHSQNNRVFRFIINPHSACVRNDSIRWAMVTIVVSSSMYTERRQAIRNTWGANGKASNSKLFFLLGTSISGNNDIVKEFELYQDIIQVDILDRYQNLTYKSVAMLQWFNDYCSNAQVYMKADDDVYVNTDNVFTKLITLANTSRFFLCHVFRNAPPNRDLRSKWYTSETEYDKPYFPTYCSGIAYIMHGTILQDLYSSARIAKYLTMEDVFITGISARDLKVTHIHDENIWWTKVPPNGCAFQKLLVAHYMTPNDMFVVFSQLQSNEVNCTTNVNKYLKIVEDMT